jgi:hypothetical protein
MSSVLEAGPNVATILARRELSSLTFSTASINEIFLPPLSVRINAQGRARCFASHLKQSPAVSP